VRSEQSSRRAISTFDSPSAAKSTIFARNTSPCGTVYRAARERNSTASTSLSSITNGLTAIVPTAFDAEQTVPSTHRARINDREH